METQYEYKYIVVVGSANGDDIIQALKEGWRIETNTCGTHCVHYVLSRQLYAMREDVLDEQ